MNRVYGYLRASTKEQDAKRAKKILESFVIDSGLVMSGLFIENEKFYHPKSTFLNICETTQKKTFKI